MAVEKGTLKILNRRKQLLTWDQIRRRQRSLDWHYLVCTDTKALVGQGPFCTAGLTKALHCRELGSPTSNRKRHLKRMVWEISCFSLGHSYTFLYSWLFILKFSLWVRILCSTCKLWLCSFHSSKFPCFPLTSIFSFPKLYWVSPLVGQPSWGMCHLTGPSSFHLPDRRAQCLGSLGRFHFSSCPRPKKSHGYKLHSVCTEIYYSFYTKSAQTRKSRTNTLGFSRC